MMAEPAGYRDSPYIGEQLDELYGQGNAQLLAEPLPGDALCAMYALMAADSRADARDDVRAVLDANQARRAAWERQRAAAEQARRAEEDQGFWGDLADKLGTVAKVAGVVAAVAVAVGTGGAGAPILALAIAGALASSASLAQSEFGVFDEICGSKEAADRLGFWLGVGGAAATLGVGVAQMVSASAGELTATAETLRDGAYVVGGAATMGAGAATIEQASCESDAGRFHAKLTRARLDAQRQAFLIEQLITAIGETKERETANVERVVKAMETQAAAPLAIAEAI